MSSMDQDVRERILSTASQLFYREGARAVGIDLVIERAGVAKASLYRHFRTKDDLIAAFLAREDEHFWSCWDEVAAKHVSDPERELNEHMHWIGERVARLNYRGCPQLNIAAEFPDADHPARKVAIEHKNELRRRLAGIAMRLRVPNPEELSKQLLVLVNGAFVSSHALEGTDAATLLERAANALVAAARS
jgi:AcrR family transcriptional regulator